MMLTNADARLRGTKPLTNGIMAQCFNYSCSTTKIIPISKWIIGSSHYCNYITN